MKTTLLPTLLAIATLHGSLSLAQTAKPTPPPEDEEHVVLSPFHVDVGVTLGGAKDARYARNVIRRGELPHPDTLTAEGFFSEHDLPLRNPKRGETLLTLGGEAMACSLLAEPQARYLAQIGFSSRLDARSWKRAPLNLVAVVDKSGSMSGEPLELVRACLHKVLSQLHPDDQLAIVLYGDRSHVHLPPTRATAYNRESIQNAIDQIQSAGSTNMEEGLKVGFELARRSQAGFRGTTRLMQFTDERPNVGDTSAEGFMGLMKAASLDGIGQTTVGVGVHFGAELAATISSVRGGNLFYFGNREEMESTFDAELDTMVSELAYDVEVVIEPQSGLRVVAVYGVPGEILRRHADGRVSFHISTLFLSKRRGAIFAAFAPVSPKGEADALNSIATVNLRYQEAGRSGIVEQSLELPLLPRSKVSRGLSRGSYLVNTFLSLRSAMRAHYLENDQQVALQQVTDLRRLLDTTRDRSLKKEKGLVRDLQGILAERSGNSAGFDCLTGVEILDECDEGHVTE